MKRVAIIVSSPVTVKAFLIDQIEALSRIYEVSLVLCPEKDDPLPVLNASVDVVTAPIVRHVSVLRDLQAIISLVALFSRKRFDAIHSITPKAGLLVALAGTIARVPVRIHTFTGQVWVTRSGLARRVLKILDKAIARLTTHVLVDSPSQRDFLMREGILSEQKSRVLAHGSICGVDTCRFRPDSESRKRIRQRLGIPDDAVVFLYVGRLKTDKGLLDLAEAFSRVAGDHSDAWLLIVGPDEENLRPRIESLCTAVRSRVRFVGLTNVPQEYMAAADVFCLPSYREGFGSVIIEAASAGLPSVASDIYGITDAIQSGTTGLLHPAGDVNSLQLTMTRLLDDQCLRERMGEEARVRAHRLFAKGLVTSALLGFYRAVLSRSDSPAVSKKVGTPRQPLPR